MYVWTPWLDQRLLEFRPDGVVPPFVLVTVAGVDGHPERASDHANSSAGPRDDDAVSLACLIGLVPGVVRVLPQCCPRGRAPAPPFAATVTVSEPTTVRIA